MAPKKDDKKKDQKGGQTALVTGVTQTISEDELNESKHLPQIRDFVYTNFFIFKKLRNETRLKDAITKQFQYNNPEDPGYSEASAIRYKQIDKNQLIAQAMYRNLLTEAEVIDLSKVPVDKVRKAFAQATVESVTAYQLSLRQKRRDQMNSSNESLIRPQSSSTTKQDELKFDQIILLKDFPKSMEDMQALVDLGFEKLNLINLIEENFIRDIDNNDAEEAEEIEYLQKKSQMRADSQMRVSQSELGDFNSKQEEVLINLVSERVKTSNAVVAINKIIKKLPESNGLRNCFVQKIKFEGPDKPMDLPKPSEDGQEVPVIDEALKTQQFQMYEDFAKHLKQEVQNMAISFQDFRNFKHISKQNSVQLWPVKISNDELARMKELEEKRAQMASREKEEAEKKAAQEAAAAKNVKADPKKQAPAKQGSVVQVVSTPDPTQEKKDQEEVKQQQKPRFLSQDDDPSKTFEFLILKKTLNEIPPETMTVGSILGAMIYQISQNQEQRHQNGLDEINSRKKQQIPVKRKSSIVLKKEMSVKNLALTAENDEINKLFEDLVDEQTINYGIVETDYQHKFDLKLTQGDCGVKNSPYMLVNSDNDKLNLKSQDEFQKNQQVYLFPNGHAQDQSEKRILDRLDLPGTKGKLNMPEKALARTAVRESQMNQVVEFCQLQPQYTKRCLVLKAFQDMMKKQLPERQFYFMDRNYIEEHKDAHIMKQVINSALLSQRPDLVTEYYELDDSLLVSLFYKNPPGRLLRRQWTQTQKVLPDFPEWFSFGKDSFQANQIAQFFEIPVNKVGLLKKNTKFMFPSDNSIIRVEKMRVSCKRLGLSQIFKDNFVFGINERKEVFQNKVEGEEGLLNRDAKKIADNRCDFWLLFENGVRLNIQMQDSQQANMDLIPPSDIQPWLKKKIALEEKIRQQEANSETMSQNNLEETKPRSSANLLSKPEAEFRQSQDESQFSKHSKNPIDEKQKAEKEPDQDEKPGGFFSDRKTDVQADITAQDEIELETQNGQLFFEDSLDLTSGAKLTFTFNEGLIVTVLPNGDVFQKNLNQPLKSSSKGQNLVQDQLVESQIEEHRIITGEGEVIKQMGDGNIIVYYLDGTITQTDKRRGVWQTINGNGIIRIRRVKGGIVSDEMTKLKIIQKVDPETNAILKIREDGVLLIDYVDDSRLTIFPDGTNILKKKRSDGDAGTVTLITKDNYAPVRLIYDPVKARARTIIGLGGTDALMGKDNIMVRSNTGKVSEVLLPDKTVVQSYLERQELEGYNRFSTSMVHLVCRSDYSVIKVRQDGEVVLITANERAYLNEQGQQIEDFGNKDYDYFFEMFGIPNERRSGVYTANLDSGKIWTQDEEGNYFIVYASGDSVEKMSVSFDLDQMVEGIEYKEPNSPRIQDGEFIEDQCKFLPPPKSMADPRLFLIKSDGSGVEFFNKAQLQHMFRTYKKEAILSLQNSQKNKTSQNLIKQTNKVLVNNEECTSHIFIQKKTTKFDPQAFDVSQEFPKLPQTLELLNQTLSIPTEPAVENYTFKNIIEFTEINQQMLNQFQSAVNQYEDLKAKQRQRQKDLTFEIPKIITTAAPPADKDTKMRSTMQSMLSNQMSPKSSSYNQQLPGNKSISPREMRESTRKALEKTIKDQMEASKRAFEQSERDKMSMSERGTEIHIDSSTGQQLVFNTMELNQMQKLQMRICQSRGIDVVTLTGKDLQVLKEYKKKQENVAAINNLRDFFDSQFNQNQQSVVAIQENHPSGDLNQFLQADIDNSQI